MAIDRINAVFIGRAKDQDGFECDVLEDPDTGQQMLAYTPEIHWQKAELAKLRATKTRRRPVTRGTPTRAWPARLPKRGA